MSRLFATYDQNIGVSTPASVLPMSILGWSPLDWLVWSPCCPRDSRESSPAPQFEGINSLVLFFLYHPALTTIHDHWEDHSLDYMDLSWQSDVSLCFSTHLFAFLPRSNHLLISWLQSPSTVILEPKKRKSVTASTFSPSIYHKVMGLDAMILVFFFLIFSFKPDFSVSLLSLHLSSLVPLCFLPLEWYHLHIWDCWYFSHLS